MSIKGLGLGADFDVAGMALSGVHIDMKNFEAVTFVVYSTAGDQGVTLKESVAGASEQNLAVIDTLYKRPGVGGVWTEITQTAAATYTLADATNDMLAFTVRATELSDTFDSLEVTTTGTSPVTMAITHGLAIARAPEKLASSV